MKLEGVASDTVVPPDFGQCVSSTQSELESLWTTVPQPHSGTHGLVNGGGSFNK